MASQIQVQDQAHTLLGISEFGPKKKRKRKTPAVVSSMSSSNKQTEPLSNQLPVIKTHDQPLQSREQETEEHTGEPTDGPAGDLYIIPKLPLSALDVPGPAGELSIPGLRATKRLVHHYIKVFAKSNCHIGSGRRFFRISLKDAALFSVNMLISAAHLDHVRKEGLLLEYYHHLGQAIQTINERLKNGVGGQTDSTIAAVACILGLETFYGTPETVRVHWMGLKHLVVARGGLKRLGGNEMVRKLIVAYDLRASVRLLEKPLFDTPTHSDVALSLQFGPPGEVTKAESHLFAERLLAYGVPNELCNIAMRVFWGLRNLTILGKTLDKPDVEDEDRFDFSASIETLMHNICDLIQTPNPCTHDTHSSRITNIFAYGSLIHLFSSIRGLPINMSMFHMFADRMNKAVCQSNVEVLSEDFPEMMLWSLFNGGKAAKGTLKPWFAGSASKILARCGVENSGDITLASEAFLWPEDYSLRKAD